METVTILWSVYAAVAIMLAVVCGLVWLIERRDRATLMLCILGIAAAVSAYSELGMMHAATAAEYGEWLRWYHIPSFVTLVGQLLFVHYYLGTGRSWLLWAVIFARSVVLAVNFSVHPNFNFSNIVSLQRLSLFGERVSVIGVVVPRPQWELFALGSLVLWLAYLLDAAARKWSEKGAESRRKALVVGLGIAVPLLFTVLYTRLLALRGPHLPLSNIVWYLGALMTMAYELGRDVILSRRARLELAELRAEVAQAERVSILAQLAPALAHELAQPLAAALLNVEAARKGLEDEKPKRDELRGILADIGENYRRAAGIIEHMRRFSKRSTIEMRPISVEDLVQDVVSLVDTEAASKHVELLLLIEPGLPRVSGDPVHLSQVLLNLIMNAIHAVQSHSLNARRVVVEARAHDAKGEVEIAVRDSGPGVPDVDEVFKPFFTTKPEGMGLGLALARTIVEAHGGRLWADCMTSENGAVFRFTVRRV
jgi:signal transduction histidine kinase